MNLLSHILAFSFLVLVLLKGVQFHRALVCRQESWQMSLDLASKALFPKSTAIESNYHPTCHVLFIRKQKQVSWQRASSLKRNIFNLDIRGSL